jgi:hypothetical protein
VTEFQAGEPVVTLSQMSLGGYATVTLAAAFPAVARSLGASRITGTVSSQAGIADTKHLDYDEVVTSDQFVTALDGRPVDIVIDPVGGDLRTARPGRPDPARPHPASRTRCPHS